MKEIAIYGKGGIGKSTITANISVALAQLDNKVLQVGCDPKHDSTRLLMHGTRITTVLDYIKETGVANYNIDELLHTGYANVGCIEAGGPKPGVGCAGRGIITVFELLEQFQVKQKYDITIYDVLGDVVCGGFAVPIRREYADTIFIVTSGEYMALYAANNILRGVKNYETDNYRVAGIIYNKRNTEGEDERVEAFSNAVGLPICATVPRSDYFTIAERERKTLMEGEDCEAKEVFRDLAKKIKLGLPLYKAMPLTDEELESTIYGAVESVAIKKKRNSEKTKEEMILENRYVSKNIFRDQPLYGCAFSGATNTSINIQDVVVLLHGPKSCAYFTYQSISSTARRALLERGEIIEDYLSPNLICTDMTQNDMIFGGSEKLQSKVEEILQDKPKAIVVISSCCAGIIGDDIDKLKIMSNEQTQVIPIKVDGNLTGDFLQGVISANIEIAKNIIDRNVKCCGKSVNIVCEKVVAKNTQSNFDVVKNMLEFMGISINCRFLCKTNYDDLKNFSRAKLNLMAHNDYGAYMIKRYLEEEFDYKFYKDSFPIGFEETTKWLRGVSSEFGVEDKAEELILSAKEEYTTRLDKIKHKLRGKQVMIFSFNYDVDWIISSLKDCGATISKLCLYSQSQDEGFRTKYNIDFPVEENYDRFNTDTEIDEIKPDIVLSVYQSVGKNKNCISDTIPFCPDVGFFSGVKLMERLSILVDLKTSVRGDWINDEKLYRQYNF